MDAAGLFDSNFGGASAAGPDAKKQRVDPNARRVKLFPWDTVASQMFNPYGKSNISDISTGKLWKAASDGNKAVMFHTELAASTDYRVGIGFSRSAEAVVAAIEQLKDPNVTKLLNPAALQAAMAEADELLPHLKVLNVGKGSEGGNTQSGFSSLRKRPHASQQGPTQEQTTTAAKAFYAWLRKEKTPLRAILSILSGDGAFYAGYAAEKTARSFVDHKPADEHAIVKACLARAHTAPEEEPVTKRDDTQGLFPSGG